MSNILKKFFAATYWKVWFVHYLARKLGVAILPQSEVVQKQALKSYQSDTQTVSCGILPPLVNENRFILESDLVISRGIDGEIWVTHKSDLIIGAALRHCGQFQENAIDDCLALLAAFGIKTDRNLFLDVGANIGTHSLHAAKLGFKQVLSLEPDPTNFKLLQANIALNGLGKQVHCRNLAASKESGTMHMELSPSNFGDHRLLSVDNNAHSVHGEIGWNTVEVAVCKLDELMGELEILQKALSLVWIDTQGHEGHVLDGAKKLRSLHCPVVVEFWPYGLERSGGYELLKKSLIDYEKIIDLGGSSPDEIKELSLQDLDRMFYAMLSSESSLISPHTDLLLIR